MTLQQLAVELTRIEGGKRQINIADASECIACLGVILRRQSAPELVETLNMLATKAGKNRK